MDPYLSARSFSTPLTIFVLACILEANYIPAAIGVIITGTIHPQMVAYLIFLIGVMWMMQRLQQKPTPRAATFASFALILPGGFHLAPAAEPYREALFSRDFYFISTWQWYHWLGMLAPLAILAWFWKANLRETRPGFSRLCFALIPFGLLSIVVALIFSSSHSFDMFARTQPLRTFHLITVIFRYCSWAEPSVNTQPGVAPGSLRPSLCLLRVACITFSTKLIRTVHISNGLQPLALTPGSTPCSEYETTRRRTQSSRWTPAIFYGTVLISTDSVQYRRDLLWPTTTRTAESSRSSRSSRLNGNR